MRGTKRPRIQSIQLRKSSKKSKEVLGTNRVSIADTPIAFRKMTLAYNVSDHICQEDMCDRSEIEHTSSLLAIRDTLEDCHVEFSLAMFVKCNLYLIFIVITGPLIGILSLFCKSLRMFAYNTDTVRISLQCLLFQLLWASNFTIAATMLYEEKIDGSLISFAIICNLMHSSFNSISISLTSKRVQQKLFEEHLVPDVDDWKQYTSSSLAIVIERSITRLRVSKGLFYLSLNKTENSQIFRDISAHIISKEQVHKNVCTERGSIEFVAGIPLLKTIIWKEQSKVICSNELLLSSVSILIAFVFAGELILSRFLFSKLFFGGLFIDIGVGIATLIYTITISTSIYKWLAYLRHIWLKKKILKAVGQMLTLRNTISYEKGSPYPLLDLACPLSLRSWLKLRDLSLDFNARLFISGQIMLNTLSLFSLIYFMIPFHFAIFSTKCRIQDKDLSDCKLEVYSLLMFSLLTIMVMITVQLLSKLNNSKKLHLMAIGESLNRMIELQTCMEKHNSTLSGELLRQINIRVESQQIKIFILEIIKELKFLKSSIINSKNMQFLGANITSVTPWKVAIFYISAAMTIFNFYQ